eukprot:GHVS01075576.1.p1 GENE.GHVS01075576.1~~GHVS01075576.1.p1  ORF type:complete len:2429 (+),score=280.12 GHVS01075576.1:174-7460(+)
MVPPPQSPSCSSSVNHRSASASREGAPRSLPSRHRSAVGARSRLSSVESSAPSSSSPSSSWDDGKGWADGKSDIRIAVPSGQVSTSGSTQLDEAPEYTVTIDSRASRHKSETVNRPGPPPPRLEQARSRSSTPLPPSPRLGKVSGPPPGLTKVKSNKKTFSLLNANAADFVPISAKRSDLPDSRRLGVDDRQGGRKCSQDGGGRRAKRNSVGGETQQQRDRRAPQARASEERGNQSNEVSQTSAQARRSSAAVVDEGGAAVISRCGTGASSSLDETSAEEEGAEKSEGGEGKEWSAEDGVTRHARQAVLPDGSLDLEFFKIYSCRNKSHVHDRKICPYFHNLRDKRRFPFTYKAEQCDEHFDLDLQVLKCSKGEECDKCHNRHELLYHPDIYKQRFCSQYPGPLSPTKHDMCTRGRYCAFAHSRAEIRARLFTEEDEKKPLTEFFMLKFKTIWCPYGVQHDWHGCVYAHTYQDCRRSPNIGYGSEPCPFWNKDVHSSDYEKRCPNGARCPYSHGSKEQLYHPAYYKTMPCVDFRTRHHCPRGKLCAFFHDLAEKRTTGLGVTGNGGSKKEATLVVTGLYEYGGNLSIEEMHNLQNGFLKPPLFNLDDFEAFGHQSRASSRRNSQTAPVTDHSSCALPSPSVGGGLVPPGAFPLSSPNSGGPRRLSNSSGASAAVSTTLKVPPLDPLPSAHTYVIPMDSPASSSVASTPKGIITRSEGQGGTKGTGSLHGDAEVGDRSERGGNGAGNVEGGETYGKARSSVHNNLCGVLEEDEMLALPQIVLNLDRQAAAGISPPVLQPSQPVFPTGVTKGTESTGAVSGAKEGQWDGLAPVEPFTGTRAGNPAGTGEGQHETGELYGLFGKGGLWGSSTTLCYSPSYSPTQLCEEAPKGSPAAVLPPDPVGGSPSANNMPNPAWSPSPLLPPAKAHDTSSEEIFLTGILSAAGGSADFTPSLASLPQPDPCTDRESAAQSPRPPAAAPLPIPPPAPLPSSLPSADAVIDSFGWRPHMPGDTSAPPSPMSPLSVEQTTTPTRRPWLQELMRFGNLSDDLGRLLAEMDQMRELRHALSPTGSQDTAPVHSPSEATAQVDHVESCDEDAYDSGERNRVPTLGDDADGFKVGSNATIALEPPPGLEREDRPVADRDGVTVAGPSAETSETQRDTAESDKGDKAASCCSVVYIQVGTKSAGVKVLSELLVGGSFPCALVLLDSSLFPCCTGRLAEAEAAEFASEGATVKNIEKLGSSSFYSLPDTEGESEMKMARPGVLAGETDVVDLFWSRVLAGQLPCVCIAPCSMLPDLGLDQRMDPSMTIYLLYLHSSSRALAEAERLLARSLAEVPIGCGRVRVVHICVADDTAQLLRDIPSSVRLNLCHLPRWSSTIIETSNRPASHSSTDEGIEELGCTLAHALQQLAPADISWMWSELLFVEAEQASKGNRPLLVVEDKQSDVSGENCPVLDRHKNALRECGICVSEGRRHQRYFNKVHDLASCVFSRAESSAERKDVMVSLWNDSPLRCLDVFKMEKKAGVRRRHRQLRNAVDWASCCSLPPPDGLVEVVSSPTAAQITRVRILRDIGVAMGEPSWLVPCHACVVVFPEDLDASEEELRGDNDSHLVMAYKNNCYQADLRTLVEGPSLATMNEWNVAEAAKHGLAEGDVVRRLIAGEEATVILPGFGTGSPPTSDVQHDSVKVSYRVVSWAFPEDDGADDAVVGVTLTTEGVTCGWWTCFICHLMGAPSEEACFCVNLSSAAPHLWCPHVFHSSCARGSSSSFAFCPCHRLWRRQLFTVDLGEGSCARSEKTVAQPNHQKEFVEGKSLGKEKRGQMLQFLQGGVNVIRAIFEMMAQLQIVEARLGREVRRRKVGRGGGCGRSRGIPAEVEGKISGDKISSGVIWMGPQWEVAVNLLSAAMQKPRQEKRGTRGVVLLSQQAAHLLVYVLTGGAMLVEDAETRVEGCRAVAAHSLYRYNHVDGLSSGMCVLCSLQHLCPVGYDLIAYILGIPSPNCESCPPHFAMPKYCTQGQPTAKDELSVTDGAAGGLHHNRAEGGERTVTPATTASMSAVTTPPTPRTPSSTTAPVSPAHPRISERAMTGDSTRAVDDGWVKELSGGWSSWPRNILLGECLSHPFFWKFETRMDMVQHIHSLLYTNTPSVMRKRDTGEEELPEWLPELSPDTAGAAKFCQQGMGLLQTRQVEEEEIASLRQNLEMWWRIGRRHEANEALVTDWCETAGCLLELMNPLLRHKANSFSNELVDSSLGSFLGFLIDVRKQWMKLCAEATTRQINLGRYLQRADSRWAATVDGWWRYCGEQQKEGDAAGCRPSVSTTAQSVVDKEQGGNIKCERHGGQTDKQSHADKNARRVMAKPLTNGKGEQQEMGLMRDEVIYRLMDQAAPRLFLVLYQLCSSIPSVREHVSVVPELRSVQPAFRQGAFSSVCL